MLTFETLLVKELQKQQSRAEFCDIVLQTQGVSVPVHSCVLSAFSPWLCGALSAMPSPRNGQKRLIEVQAVEACTLLSLVSLLYSGQYKEDKEEVLSAACKLGINIPQRKRKKQATEQNTQTEWMKEVAERECQTETLSSECQNPKDTVDTVNLIGPPSWRSDQGLCTYTDGSDITLAGLQNVQGNGEDEPSFQVMDVVPETAVYPSVSGPACLPQVYVCPPPASYQQPSVLVPSHPQPSFEPLASQAESAVVGVSEGEECVLEAFARFENNIPGFINYFLDANISQGAGQREESQRGMRGDVKNKGRARPGRWAGANGGSNLKRESFNVCKRQQNMNRCGRVAGLAWMGQGGGRVGRMLDTRQVFKNQGRRKQKGGGAMKEEGGRGRSSSRARQRGTGSRGRLIEPAGQDTAPPPRRRGRPRKNPLPQPNFSQNPRGPSPPEPKTINPPAPSLMHTSALPAAGLTQPMDWLIDDVIAQLPFMPNNQNGIPNTVAVDHSRAQSSVKLTDIGTIQPQAEGELTDILDSFLRTFEKHVGTCDSDVQEGLVPNVTDGSQTCRQSAQNYTHGTSRNTTAQGSKISLSENRPQAARKPQKPSGYWQMAGVKMEKPAGQQGEEIPDRITRSQSRKRKLEVIEELPRRDHRPPKQKKKRKRKQKNEELHNGEPICTRGTFDSNGHVGSTLRTVRHASASNVKNTDTLPSSERSTVCHDERDATKPLLEGSTLATSCSTESSQPQESMAKSKTTGSRPAVSAFEIVKKILENQQKRKEEQKNHNMWAVKKTKGKERLKNKRACGADGEMTDNREKHGGIRDEGHNNCRRNQKDEETRRRMKRAGNQMTLESAKDHTTSKGKRLSENSYNKARSETADSTSASPFHRCSTEGVLLKDITDMPFASDELEIMIPHEELRNTQLSTDSSDEDVDVVEVSSSLPKPFAVLPVTDIVLSSEDEDSDENVEIDIISLGSD